MSRRSIALAVLAAAALVGSSAHDSRAAAVPCPCPACVAARAGVAPGEGGSSPALFQIDSRWTTTSSGSAGSIGTPITLRWGFVPDATTLPTGNVAGESADPSNLISYLDANFGAGAGGTDLTQRPWFSIFSSSFNRWGQLAGITYVYEPNDDGAPSPLSSGVTGVRADVRIGGHALDGNGGVLAYNYYPGYADMVIDTSDTLYPTSPTNAYRAFRNIIMHEHGHGLGLAHVDSNNSTQLMEPYLDTSFDGPQLDDILAAQRSYGDPREKGTGNNTVALASKLGKLYPGATLSVGTSAPTTNQLIPSTATDFVSITNSTDVDFYSFSSDSAFILSLVLQPVGYTYNQGPQGGTQAAFNAQAQSDLSLALYAPDGVTRLAYADSYRIGTGESISNLGLPGGTYYARVTGKTAGTDVTQLYRLDITSLSSLVVPEPAGAGFLLGGLPVGLARRRRSS